MLSRMGSLVKDGFKTFKEAAQDYREKLKLDKLEYFDDKFVVGFVDKNSFDVKVKRCSIIILW